MDEGDDMDVSPDGATFKRACDSCRTRKIRCDRAAPCSNCKTSKLTCTTTAPTQKAQRQRVHISEQYEKKIDRIEDRLSGIENVLETLASKLGNVELLRDSTDTSSQSRSSRVGAGKSPGPTTAAATPTPFEGETTLNSQSDYARKFLARVVGSTPSIGQNAEIKSALTALGELAAQQSQDTASALPLVNRSLKEIDPGKLDRPPWDTMIHVLDKATEHPTLAFAIIFPFLMIPNLKEIFENAYQYPSSCTAARRVLVYGIMASLFAEFEAFPLFEMDVSNFGTYSVWCKRHLEVAMNQLDIFMPASYENIMALLLGATQAVGMCKPSLSWTMTSTAAGMCQNLGYHRINTMINDTPEMRKCKIHTFWLLYMLDKTLSLRLGRAGAIQDWDISLPFVLPGDGTIRDSEGSRLLAYWVKVARVQGQAYEKLFSPAAFLRSPEERTRTAVELVGDMNMAWYERGETMVADYTSQTYFHKNVTQQQTVPNETEIPSRWKPLRQQSTVGGDSMAWFQVSFERIRDIFFHSNVVMHYSICALIQRAINPDNVTFNQDCLESSRAALLAHRTANLQFNTRGNEELWSGYISWSILQAPFTPFIVIFCNAIQNADSSDLASMSDFVISLESCRTISEGADRLYKMCHLFHRVAKLYIQAKRQHLTTTRPPSFAHHQPSYYTPTDGTQLDLNAIKEFDPYLSALGLVPSSEWPMPGYSDEFSHPGVSTFAQSHAVGGFVGLDVAGMGLGPSSGSQNSIQEWFSGSRYLMNLMEAGDDSQMPDLDL